MPKFLTTDEVYRLIQRELPEDAYPDGPATAFFSTADSYATAKEVGDAYSSLSSIYDNYSPLYAVQNLPDHEVAYLGAAQDAALGVDGRRARLLTQVRSRHRPTKQDLIDRIHTIIDPSAVVTIIAWNSPEGSWMIGESALGDETYLAGARLVDATGPNLCSQTPADFGLTQQEWDDAREQAYTYQVFIFDYTPTALEMAEIEATLSASETARSQHIITLAHTPTYLTDESGDGLITESGQSLEIE